VPQLVIISQSTNSGQLQQKISLSSTLHLHLVLMKFSVQQISGGNL
jgi:hypothetical protein